MRVAVTETTRAEQAGTVGDDGDVQLQVTQEYEG